MTWVDSKWLKMTRMTQHDSKWLKMVLDDLELPKMTYNYSKWQIQNDWKWDVIKKEKNSSEWLRMTQNELK